ncbi:MAG: hypothetical protein QOG65_689, partial [Actinomycetota bacterium]|nr:hypothetical protein [Actinomycetota bacterium]
QERGPAREAGDPEETPGHGGAAPGALLAQR